MKKKIWTDLIQIVNVLTSNSLISMKHLYNISSKHSVIVIFLVFKNNYETEILGLWFKEVNIIFIYTY